MSMPFQYREESCYRFMSSGFNLEETVAWMMTEYWDDPTISRASNAERLCANILTMGGTGANRTLNVAAFGNAYRRFASEVDAYLMKASKAEVAKLHNDLQGLRDRFDQSQRDLDDANDVIQRHLVTINMLDRENAVYQLEAGVASDDVSAEAAN